MLKLIINNDEQHLINITHIYYDSNFQITNFQEHKDTITINLSPTALENLRNFEDTEITSILVLNNTNDTLMTFSFNNNTYITHFTAQDIQESIFVEVTLEPIQ